jgi:lysophospholipase L1-like esterase
MLKREKYTVVAFLLFIPVWMGGCNGAIASEQSGSPVSSAQTQKVDQINKNGVSSDVESETPPQQSDSAKGDESPSEETAPKADVGKAEVGKTDARKISLGDDGILRIWTIGDSITKGANNGYRNRIFTELSRRKIKVDFVGTQKHAWPDQRILSDPDHNGHPHWTSKHLRENINSFHAQIASPDVALLMVGTNSLAWWLPGSAKMSDIAARTMKLVNTILGLDSDLFLIVSTIPPMSSKVIKHINRDRAELTKEHNAELVTAVRAHPQYEKRLWLADVHSVLTASDLNDGIHPSRKAHDKVADAWLKTLVPLLPK